ncbi:MAG: ABC transporter ATP-binding protein [Phycisphaerae bacterium]
MKQALTVQGARKAFGATQALLDADLTLRAGECHALLGPNGAGKTTLIRAVVGRVLLDAGEVRLFGEAVPEPRPADVRRRMGVVPQEIAIYPLLTPRENLMAFGAFAGLRGDELKTRVDWALAWTGLADRERDRAGTFSGGMKRRLNIACGVLHKPEIILLDEPTVGVDPQSRARIWEMCDELRREGAALLLTSHQLDETQRVSDRITIIDHGKTIASGTFGELVQRTVGADRHVTLHLSAALRGMPDRCAVDEGGRVLRTSLGDVATELPPLLTQVKSLGGVVEDLSVEPPTLQAVFLHLTGRELRE